MSVAERARALFEIYEAACRPPEWALEFAASPAYNSFAKATAVLSFDRRADLVREVVERREPVNIGMHRRFDAGLLRARFGYDRAGYVSAYERSLTAGAPALPPNIAILCRTPVGSAQGRVVDIINATGFAFDDPRQVDYRYFALGGRLPELRAKLRAVFGLIFAAALYRRKATLVLSLVGGGAFSAHFPGGAAEYLASYFFPALRDAWAQLPPAARPARVGLMGNPSRAQLAQLAAACEGVLTTTAATTTFACGVVPDILSAHEDALFVNAWDPCSIVGNGHAADNSLDGAIGRCTALAFLSFPPTNPHIQIMDANEILQGAKAAGQGATASGVSKPFGR